MSLSSCTVDGVDYFGVCLHLPKNLLFLEIQYAQFSLQVTEGKTGMGGGRGCECS